MRYYPVAFSMNTVFSTAVHPPAGCWRVVHSFSGSRTPGDFLISFRQRLPPASGIGHDPGQRVELYTLLPRLRLAAELYWSDPPPVVRGGSRASPP